MQRKLYCVRKLVKIRHQRGGFANRIILIHRHKINIFGIHQSADILRASAQGIIGAHSKHKGPTNAQMALAGHRNRGIGNAERKLCQCVARAGRHHQYIA